MWRREKINILEKRTKVAKQVDDIIKIQAKSKKSDHNDDISHLQQVLFDFEALNNVEKIINQEE